MPQGTKLKQLPKLDEWKAPWEVDADGNDIPAEEQQIDKDQLKRYLYNLQSDKIKFRNQLDDTSAQAEELQQKLADAKTPEELAKLQEENARLLKERDDAKEKAKGSADALKWEVALEKGLTKTQAKRLVGSTREELEADADELLAEFGHAGEPGGGETIRRAPRRNLTNSGDPDPAAKPDGEEVDPEKVVAAYFKNRR